MVKWKLARAIDWTLCPYLMVFSAVIDPSGGVGGGHTYLQVFRNMPSTDLFQKSRSANCQGSDLVN